MLPKTEKVLLLLIALGVLGMSGCGGSKLSAQQKQGKRIYEALCNKCHQLIDPTAHNDAEWSEAVDKYGAKLQLTEEEKSAVKAYLAVADKQNTQR